MGLSQSRDVGRYPTDEVKTKGVSPILITENKIQVHNKDACGPDYNRCTEFDDQETMCIKLRRMTTCLRNKLDNIEKYREKRDAIKQNHTERIRRGEQLTKTAMSNLRHAELSLTNHIKVINPLVNVFRESMQLFINKYRIPDRDIMESYCSVKFLHGLDIDDLEYYKHNITIESNNGTNYSNTNEYDSMYSFINNVSRVTNIPKSSMLLINTTLGSNAYLGVSDEVFQNSVTPGKYRVEKMTNEIVLKYDKTEIGLDLESVPTNRVLLDKAKGMVKDDMRESLKIINNGQIYYNNLIGFPSGIDSIPNIGVYNILLEEQSGGGLSKREEFESINLFGWTRDTRHQYGGVLTSETVQWRCICGRVHSTSKNKCECGKEIECVGCQYIDFDGNVIDI